MKAAVSVLCILCIAQAVYIHRVNRQLSDWLDYLRSIKNAPWRKNFTKGRGVLPAINYEINSILDENRKQLVKLAKAEDANRQILTNLSHDVRTPLASLTGYLEELDQGRVSGKERQEYVHVAYRKSQDLKNLVDILFEWFKISSKEQEYQMREYDVNELTRQIIIGYLPLLEKENIRLEIQIPEEEWYLLLDKTAYERILGNLFGNALKHGKCSVIMIGIQKNEGGSGDMAIIEIANNGVMIPETEMPYIFDRLYKGGSRSQNGSGLGLAIAKELAAAMQGNITALSRQGRTSFYLHFPLSVRKK